MKRLMVFMSVPFLLSLIAAGIFGLRFACAAALIAGLFLAAGCFARLTDKPPGDIYAAVAMLVILASGVFACFEYFLYMPIVSCAGEELAITGVIVDKTQTDYGKYSYVLKTKTINGEKNSIKIKLTLPRAVDAECYDTITGDIVIYRLGTTSEKSLISCKAKGIYVGGYSFEEIKVTPVDKKPPMYYIARLRGYIKNNITETLTSDEGDLLLGMTIGDKQRLSPAITDDFRRTGISHLLAVSGLHLSVWSGFVMGILDRIKAKKRMSAIACCLFVLVFMAVTGFTFSVIRAGTAVLIYLFGIIIRREPDALSSLCASVFIIGMMNPFAVLDPGFLLSFFATLGIILLSKPIQDFIFNLTGNLKSRYASALTKAALEIIGVTLAASVFTIPINIFYFGRICLISPLSNLIITTLATLAMILGGIGALMPASFILLDILRRPLMLISGLICKLIINVSAALSDIGLSSVSIDKTYGAIAVACALMVLVIAVNVKGDLRKNLKKAVAAVCYIALLTPFVNMAFNNNLTQLTVTDVGNGISLVVSKGGSVWVIGCAGEYAAASKVENIVLSKSDKMDMLFIPGSRATECSGVPELLKNVKYGGVISAVDWISIDDSDEPFNFRSGSSGKYKTGKGISLEYSNNTNYCAAFLSVDGIGILILFYPPATLFDLPENWLSNSRILICRGYTTDEYVKYNFENIILSSDKPSIYKNVFSTADIGNIDIRMRASGAYSVRRSVDA